jgi:hypothetical protein
MHEDGKVVTDKSAPRYVSMDLAGDGYEFLHYNILAKQVVNVKT